MSLQKMPKIKQTMKKIHLQILNWTQNKLEGDHMPKIYASIVCYLAVIFQGIK